MLDCFKNALYERALLSEEARGGMCDLSMKMTRDTRARPCGYARPLRERPTPVPQADALVLLNAPQPSTGYIWITAHLPDVFVSRHTYAMTKKRYNCAERTFYLTRSSQCMVAAATGSLVSH